MHNSSHITTIRKPAARRARAVMLFGGLILGAGLWVTGMNTAHAATPVSNTFQVTATVVTSCTVSGSQLNFGSSIDALGQAVPLDAASTLTVNCSNTTPYTVSLNAGANAGGPANFTNRLMVSGANTLAYQLYLDTGRSSVWGDGTASSSTKAGTGTGAAQSLSVYGRIPTLANAVPGSYTDTVTVTVSY